MDYHLRQLEKKSVYIIRETKTKFRNIAVLWSMSEDSTTLLFLCKRTFFGEIPLPVIHLDNGHNFPETYQFRDKIVKEWGINLLIAKTEFKKDLNKINALKKIVQKHKFDALLVPIRKGYPKTGTEETHFSLRNKDFHWDSKRVYPMLDWTELDVWQYIKEEDIPVNPLYFAKNGKRYQNIGYSEATSPVESNAQTVEDIIKELKITQAPEQQGRIKNREEDIMRRLRELGYI